MTNSNTLLQRLQKSLNILQERRAKYSLDAPVSLINEIDDHRTAISLTEQLAAGQLTESDWRKQLKPLLVKIEERQATEEVNNLNIGGVNFSHISHSTINVGNIDASVHIHEQPTISPRDKNLTILLSNVRKIWVEDYLNSALLNAIYLDLGLETKEDAVPQHNPFEELNIRLRQPEQREQDLPAGTRAIDVYRQAGGSLLILGQPGAGKTTTLATLAGDLVAEAENDASAPVPVIFNLSSWATEQKSLGEWLAEELNRQYGVPRKLAERWLAEGKLALLLDGLDEVAAEQREACVEAINTYRERESAEPVVVCSRLNDYEALEAELKLEQAIVLKKLTQHQVEHYIKRLQDPQGDKQSDYQVNDGLMTLFKQICQDKALQELIETPLMLNIVIVTYAHPEAPPLPEKQDQSLKSQIFDAYSKHMFNRVGRTEVKLLYAEETSLDYLRYLAAQLQNHSLTQFSVGQIRGSWLPSGSIRRQYRWFSGLIGGISTGLSFWLVGGLVIIINIGVGLSVWLSVALSVALSGGLIGGLTDKEPAERMRWSWKPILSAIGWGILGGILGGGTVGLLAEIGIPLPHWVILGLSVWLSVLLIIRLSSGQTGGLIGGMSGGLIGGLTINGLAYGLINGLIFGLSVGLIAGLIGGLSSETVSHKFESAQELSRSWRSSLIGGLSVGLVFGLIVGLLGGLLGGLIFGLSGGLLGILLGGVFGGMITALIGGLIFGLTFGPIGGYFNGGSFLIQYYMRLYLLNKHNLLPFKLIPFLDQATELIFLQRIGGSYRFIHRSVQEYFAEQWGEANEPMMETSNEQESTV